MSTSVASVTKFFPTAQNGFQTSLASTISAGAATVPLNSVAGYTNGDTVVMIVDPLTSAKQAFTGVVDTAGVQITGAVWTSGTNVQHAGGAVVVDYTTATHMDMVTKGILVNHSQSGSHKTLTDANGNEWAELGQTASAVNQVKISNAATGTNPTLSANGDDANIGLTLTPKGSGAVKMTGNYDAWVPLSVAPTTITALGNRSYTILVPGVDYTDRLSPGMRLKLTRTVAAPAQCTSLNGTTQFYSKTSPAGMTFTNNFVVTAWIKLASYPGSTGSIVSRWNATSGWVSRVNADGTLEMFGANAGSSNFASVKSFQSIPLNKWVHVAFKLDMSSSVVTGGTNNYIMIDGVDVPVSFTRGGTNPTSLVQAGNLEVGSANATTFFPGKIAQAAIYGAHVSEATILAAMHQTLAGSETSLISAYSFNNSINDLNANANNLTANGSAVATNADSPYAQAVTAGTIEYGLVTASTFSTNTTLTVQVPEGSAIPTSGGVLALSYSGIKVPYGFPAQRSKWQVSFISRVAQSQVTAALQTWYNIGSAQLNVPIGSWNLDYAVVTIMTLASGAADVKTTLSTANNTESDTEMSANHYNSSSTQITGTLSRSKPFDLSSATMFYLNTEYNTAASSVTLYNYGSVAATVIRAEPAHL